MISKMKLWSHDISFIIFENLKFVKKRGVRMEYLDYAKLRDERGLKDIDVAKATGLNQPLFTNWKQGRYMPKIDKIKKIADYFGVPIGEYI